MAMISPTEGKSFERDPEEGNFPTGVYLCKLTRVEETGPGAKFPNGNNRLVFEFTVDEGQYKGKTAIAFLGKTLHKSKDGRESNLVKWARMMGVRDPEKGFDPDTLVGKVFQVTCEYTPGTNGHAGRAWARTAIIASSAPASFANSPTAGGHWDYTDGSTVVPNVSTADLRAFLSTSGIDPAKIRAKPHLAPGSAAKPCSEIPELVEGLNPDGTAPAGGQIPW